MKARTIRLFRMMWPGPQDQGTKITQYDRDRSFKWHVSFGQNFDAIHLDDRGHWRRQGIDADKHVAEIRATGDREAEKRGLMFIGEQRLGKEVQRQYVVPTFWWRLRFLLLRPRLLKPAGAREAGLPGP